jgi:hypothetical protein
MTIPTALAARAEWFESVQAPPSIIKPDLLWHLFSFTPPQQARHVVSDGNLFLLQPRKYTNGE